MKKYYPPQSTNVPEKPKGNATTPAGTKVNPNGMAGTAEKPQ